MTRILQRAGVARRRGRATRAASSDRRQGRTWSSTSSRLAATTNPRGLVGPPRRGAGRRRRLRRRLRRARCPRRTSPRWRRDAMVFALANPTPRCTPTSPPGTRPSWPPAARTSPTRSTTCWPSRASSAAPWTAGATQITEEMKLAAAHAIADLVRAPDRRRDRAERVPRGGRPAVAAAVARSRPGPAVRRTGRGARGITCWRSGGRHGPRAARTGESQWVAPSSPSAPSTCSTSATCGCSSAPRALGDRLVVGRLRRRAELLARRAARRSSPRPSGCAIVGALKVVDEVFVEESLELKRDYIEQLRRRRAGHGRRLGRQVRRVRATSARSSTCTRTPAISTTALIEKISTNGS